MIHVMDPKPRLKPVYFRMPPDVKLALVKTVAELGASGLIDGTVTQESVVGAAVLWLEEMGVDAASAALARHIARWDSLREVPASSPSPDYDQATTVYPPSEAAPKRPKKKSG